MAVYDRDVPARRRGDLLRRGTQWIREAMSRTQTPLNCRQMVELVTAYLEGALDPAMRSRFEAHLQNCDGCATYLEELRVTIATMGALREEDLDPVYRQRLLDAFSETNGSW